jgi:predicted dehydrogenase
VAKKTLGVGLVSVGWMGKMHARAYRSLPLLYPELGAECRLVHAADPVDSAREFATDVLGFERACADYHEVLHDPEVDVVSICSPNFLHAEMGVAAADAGKAFWIEKPVGRGVGETRQVETAADAAGVATSTGFNYRYPPAVQYARHLISIGALGRITNVSGRYFGGFSSNPDDPLAWRFIRQSSGSGVLGDLMGHLVDQIHYLVGPIGSVTATTGTYITHRRVPDGAPNAGELAAVENEDYANMLVRFDDFAVAAGALGSLEASRIAAGPRCEYAFEIFGTEGSLRWEFERLNELQVAQTRVGPNVGYTALFANQDFPDFARFQPGTGTGMGYDDLKTIEAARFVSSHVGGDLPAGSNIHDAVASAQILSAAETSAASGSWVETPVIPGTTANIFQQGGS